MLLLAHTVCCVTALMMDHVIVPSSQPPPIYASSYNTGRSGMIHSYQFNSFFFCTLFLVFCISLFFATMSIRLRTCTTTATTVVYRLPVFSLHNVPLFRSGLPGASASVSALPPLHTAPRARLIPILIYSCRCYDSYCAVITLQQSAQCTVA
jgi:hypothetical protein